MEKFFKNNQVGIIGDVILDKYKYFKAIRLSPEGPAPVVRFISQSLSLGGAANVALSIANLGLNIELNYAEAAEEEFENIKFLKENLSKSSVDYKRIKSNLKNAIPLKIRYYVDGKQFMREDIEENNIPKVDLLSNKYIEKIIQKYDVLILSDYQKGLISNNVMQNIISLCNFKNIPLFIDTKNIKKDCIKNAFCLKINESEFNNLFKEYKIGFDDPSDLINNKLNLARKSFNITNLILTLGSRGSFLSNPNIVSNIKAEKVDILDITGAGDAFLAAIVYSFIKRNEEKFIDLKENFINQNDLKFANKASSSVISLKGTEPIPKDFLNSLNANYLIKKKIGFTNGCFDLLHLGHLEMLKQAKENCDYLIIGLNSDNSIKRLKGNFRPINDQRTRSKILESLEFVDEVRIFDDDTPLRLIKEISPDVLMKGGDYKENQIVGAEYVRSYGGNILILNFLPDLSTTKLLKKIKQNKY